MPEARLFRFAPAALIFSMWVQLASPALAGDASLSIELNGLQATDNGCLFTFVASNKSAMNLSKVGYEVAIFNDKGLVERLTVFDFRDLPAGKTKVRQFDLSGANCSNLSRLLINDVSACEGQSQGKTLCAEVTTGSKSEVAFDS